MISKIVNAGMGIGQHDWTPLKVDVFMGIAAIKWDAWNKLGSTTKNIR
jgi:hypothetical protein